MAESHVRTPTRSSAATTFVKIVTIFYRTANTVPEFPSIIGRECWEQSGQNPELCGRQPVPRSRTDKAAVSPAVLGHESGLGGARRVEEFRCRRLVDIDPEPRCLVPVHVAPFGDRVAWEDRQFAIGEVVLFLDAEVPAGQIQMVGSQLVDRVVVAAFLPCGVDTVELAQVGDLAGRRDSAGLAHSDAHVVDKSVLNEGQVLGRIDEQFAHCLGCRADLLDVAVVGDVFGRQDVFHEEQAVWFERLGQRDGLVRAQVLVDVVGELRAIAEVLSQGTEHLRHVLEVSLIVESPALRRVKRGTEGRCSRPATFAGGCRFKEASAAVRTKLAPDVDPSVVDVVLDVGDQFIDRVAGRMGVDRHGGAAPPPKKAVDRQTGFLAQNVPQGHVCTGNHGPHDGILTPVP